MITGESADSRAGTGESTLAPLSPVNMRSEAGARYQAVKQRQRYDPPSATQWAGYPAKRRHPSRIATLLAERRTPCDVRRLGDEL